MWAACLCPFGWPLPHLHFWITLYHRKWPQVSWKDLTQEPGWCPSLFPAYASSPPRLWLHHQVQTNPRDGSHRYPLQVLTKECTWDQTWCLCELHTHKCWEKSSLQSCCWGWPTYVWPHRHDHIWMAWWHKRCSQGSLPISHLVWCTDHWTWNRSLRRSPPHPSCWEGEGTMCHRQRTSRHHQVPVLSMTMCLLAWDQLWHQTNG